MIPISYSEEEQLFTHMALVEVLQQLSPKQRIVVALICAGYSRTECGMILGLTRQAAGATFKRAIFKIREALEKYEEDAELYDT